MTPLARWHAYAKEPDYKTLLTLLHQDAVFHSPVVHTPQRGKAMTAAYLTGATTVFNDGNFEYLREFDCGDRAVLEFRCTIEGIEINGVDLIEWDADGLITDFKVMVRPLKAMNMLHQKMGEMLAQMQSGGT